MRMKPKMQKDTIIIVRGAPSPADKVLMEMGQFMKAKPMS